jgi:DNA helicase II / ATP-dependent DNA helicase PcrA
MQKDEHSVGREQSKGIALNDAQIAAKETLRGPLLIVAGAGTGKTRTLIARLAYFIETGIPPERICAITFTNKAAKEMRDRVGTTTDSKQLTTDKKQKKPSDVRGQVSNVHKPFIGTFHALGLSILRRESRAFGRKPNFAIFDDHDSFALVKYAYKMLVPKKKGDEEKGKTSFHERPSFFAGKISEIKNKFGVLEQLGNSSRQEDILTVKIFEAYERALTENNAFDFDDLITKPVELFRTHPDVLKKYQNRFDAILVDEYQDVSPMQNELVKLLAAAHKNVSVVGDDEQLIYGWRYADLKIFLGFEKDWPGARIMFLEENYRSSGNIINAAAAVVANNQYRRPKTLWTKNPEGALIHIMEAIDEIEEAERIAQQIYTSRLTAPDETIAILYRTNAQSRAIEQGLIRRQIPYHIFGGIKFYERMEVKDIVAGLRYFANNADTLSRARLEKNLTKTLFRELQAAFARTDKAAKPESLVELFLKTTDYLDYIERSFANASERKENIVELLSFAARFEDLQKFLEEVALVQAIDIPSKSTRDKRLTADNKNDLLKAVSPESLVHLSTIHLAKGLEFDRVFIAGCAEGFLPHARSLENEYQLEEERRLMYVAMTRAKKELVVSFYDVPSRFLSEMPQNMLKFKNFGERNRTQNIEEEFVDIDE